MSSSQPSSSLPPQSSPSSSRTPMNNRTNNSNNGVTSKSSKSSGGAFYGMFRKTKRRTFRRNSSRRKNNQNVTLENNNDGDDEDNDGRGTLHQQQLSNGTPNYGSPSTSSNGMRNGWNGFQTVGVADRGLQQHQDIENDNIESILHAIEPILRKIIICCIMFISGTIYVDQAPVVYHMLELSAVAWGTCLFIIILAWFQNNQRKTRVLQPHQQLNDTIGLVMGPPRLERSSRTPADRREILFHGDQTPIETISKKRSIDELEQPLSTGLADTPPPTPIVMQPTTINTKQVHQRQQHPHLDNLYAMLVDKKQERIFPNTIETEVDNDLFYGKMLLMFRTPDVDVEEPTTMLSSSNSNPSVSNYFRGKQRRFEFQWQLRLKKVPTGDVFFCAEVDEPIQMGMIQRAVASAALKFTKKMNQGFTYHFAETPESSSYLSFPVETSMDRFNATLIGEPLPILGQEIVEDHEMIKQRKKGTKIEWSTDYVYTMAIWSAYVDWIDWQILNFPGIRPFSVTSVVGVQPIMLNLYTQPSEATGTNPKRDICFTIEMSNASKATLGKEAKKWVVAKKHTKHAISEATDAGEFIEEVSSIDGEGDGTLDENEEMSVNDNEYIDEQSDDDDDDDEDNVDDLAEDDNGLELDNSCYLLSGSTVYLRERTGSYVASGGGYAVLQSSPTSSIILEKHQSKKRVSSSSLIRCGDVVRIKLVDMKTKNIKWLVLYRGWWLKWEDRPKKNGLFSIFTEDTFGSLVMLQGSFSLVSRRYPNYTVGACFESSTKYGGRMLGIYKTGKQSVTDDGPMQQDNQLDEGEKVPNERMIPLSLYAELFDSSHVFRSSPIQSPKRESTNLSIQLPTDMDLTVRSLVMTESERVQQKKLFHIDAPVWIEMMDRTSRTKQLVYVVRVKETILTQSNESSELDSEVATTRCFVKLRTGKDLAPILRLGAGFKPELSLSSTQYTNFDFRNQDDELNDDADSSSSSSSDDSSDSEEEIEDDDDDEQSHFLIAGPNHDIDIDPFTSNQGDAKVFIDEEETQATDTEQDALATSHVLEENEAEHRTKHQYLSNQLKTQEKSDCESAAEESFIRVNSGQDLDQKINSESKKKSRIKHAAVIGRVAKTVKSSTVITGKHVIKTSKNIGMGTVKGTMSATRAAGRVIPVYKTPRKHEPGGRVHRRSSNRRQIKMIGRAIKNIEGKGNFSTSLLSGQLLASDQSCRKVSQILSIVSQDAIPILASAHSNLDLAFLRGSSAELGVNPIKSVDPNVDVDCIIARCMYAGKWREEYCVLYTNDQHIAFYGPLAKKPSLAVSFDEILSASIIEENSSCPLPGYHLLSINTTWKCQYLAFLDVKSRDNFLGRLNNALFHTMGNSHHSSTQKVAQEFESYRMSLETSLTGAKGKWCAVSIHGKKAKKQQRRVLNSRRMPFDIVSILDEENGKNTQEKVALYVEGLLRMALSFSPDTLDAADSRFIAFLDETSRLRTMPLQEIDLTSKEAFCIFVNLYHCLLQHALLLAVDGIPNKRSVQHFKRCSCYEIGEDVLSLAELECCVVRGKMSRPLRIKAPFVDAPTKSKPYRLIYGLGFTDYRINFILHNGDMSRTSLVPILQQSTLDDQMNEAAAWFLMDQVKIDTRKRTVFLPQICDIYRNDFGDGDPIVCLSQCLIYLDESSQLAIAELLEGGVVSVKFKRTCDNFLESLSLV